MEDTKINKVRELPEVYLNGYYYTIDFALNEIRRFDCDTMFKFLKLDSVDGQYILKQYYKSINQ